MSQSKNKKVTQSDLKYLHNIFQIFEQNNDEPFNLEQLDERWLTTDRLYQSAIYWRRYYWTRIIGSVISFPLVLGYGLIFIFLMWVDTIGSAGEGGGIMGGIVIMIIVAIIIARLSARGIGHSIAFLLELKPGKPFDSESMRKSDYKAIQWVLQKNDLLPPNYQKWLREMIKNGAIVQTAAGFHEFASTEFTDWLEKKIEEVTFPLKS